MAAYKQQHPSGVLALIDDVWNGPGVFVVVLCSLKYDIRYIGGVCEHNVYTTLFFGGFALCMKSVECASDWPRLFRGPYLCLVCSMLCDSCSPVIAVVLVSTYNI